jgi:hypothetical protein
MRFGDGGSRRKEHRQDPDSALAAQIRAPASVNAAARAARRPLERNLLLTILLVSPEPCTIACRSPASLIHPRQCSKSNPVRCFTPVNVA